MTKVTFVGGPECGNIGSTSWPYGPPGSNKEIVFPLNVPVEVTDQHILKKIRGQLDKGWWAIEGEGKDAPGTGENDESGASDEGENGESSSEAGTLRGSTRQRKHS